MAILHVRSMDDVLYGALGRRAARENRSISQEVIEIVKTRRRGYPGVLGSLFPVDPSPAHGTISAMAKVFHVSASFAEAEQWDTRQHREMPPDDRLDAVEFLREQCWIAAGMRELPRIQKTGRILGAAEAK